MSSNIIRCRRFVGRQAALGDLMAAVVHAPPGGSLITVEGEAGLGKSRLIAEFATHLERAGAACSIATCFAETNAPFAPFGPVLRSLIGPASGPLEPWLAQSLASILPELGAPEQPPRNYTAQDKRRQFDALAEVLRRHSSHSRCIIVIEDVHWSDVASLEFLHFLVSSRISPRPAVVLTYRADELEESDTLRPIFVRLQRGIDRRIVLAPLTDREMDVLMSDALAGIQMPEERRRAVRARVEGNPLFAEELLRHVVEAAPGAAGARMPATIRETVLTRFRRLSAGDRHVLLVAAVIGRSFESALLAAAAPCSPGEVARVLHGARDLQLVEEQEAGRFRFRHALTREALYGELLATEAQALHAAILAQLEARPQDALIHDLAYHAWAAGDAQTAARYNERAGDAALAARAPIEAEACFRRALPFVHSDADLGRLWKKIAIGADFASAAPRAQAALQQAVTHFENAGADEEIADLYLRLAVTYNLTGEIERFFATLMLARDAFRGEHDLVRLALNAQYCAGMGNLAEAEASLRAAEKLLADADDLSLVRFFHARATTHFAAHRPAEAIADAQRALDHATRAGDVRERVLTMLRLGWRFQEAVQAKNAIEIFGEAAALAEAEHYFGYAAWALAFRARQELAAGALEAARDSLRASLRHGADADLPQTRHFHFDSGLRLASRLQDAALLAELEDALGIDLSNPGAIADEFSPFMGALAEVLFARGAPDEARAALRRAAAGFRADEPAVGNARKSEWTCIMTALHGDAAAIAPARENLIASQKVYPPAGAVLALFDAYAAARRGGAPVEVRSLAENAARALHAVERPHEAALALELAGRLPEALAIYRRIGNRRDSARLEVALTPINRQGRAATALTRRETQIAELVAQRKSNKEIAHALSISERTVETHMSTMFGKLGIKSRLDLAAVAAPTAQR